MTQPTILVLPGLGNSGPDHWQTWLEGRLPALTRVDLGDWDAPEPDRWVERLDHAVRSGRIGADEIARLTFEAIEEDRFYIITHPKIMPSIRQRGAVPCRMLKSPPWSLR